jgi:predicted nucleotidyltransferase component of viral defense system
MIKEWLASYNPTNELDAQQALREILQEITLAGLQRAGFFEIAAFYGGTALRIFHGLNRFSEDLDFSLLKPDKDFQLEPFFSSIINEAAALGIQLSIKEKTKTKDTNIDSAFLKSETVWKELIIEGIIPQAGLLSTPSIKIKIEIDTLPPQNFETEELLLLKPFSFYVKCFTLPNLFAGKMHALLFRKWKQRVKGRDWYDMEWYIQKGISLNLHHLATRAKESGDLENGDFTKSDLLKLLNAKIESVNMNNVKDDIKRFIPNNEVLDIWTAKYFKDLVAKIKTE